MCGSGWWKRLGIVVLTDNNIILRLDANQVDFLHKNEEVYTSCFATLPSILKRMHALPNRRCNFESVSAAREDLYSTLTIHWRLYLLWWNKSMHPRWYRRLYLRNPRVWRLGGHGIIHIHSSSNCSISSHYLHCLNIPWRKRVYKNTIFTPFICQCV